MLGAWTYFITISEPVGVYLWSACNMAFKNYQLAWFYHCYFFRFAGKFGGFWKKKIKLNQVLILNI